MAKLKEDRSGWEDSQFAQNIDFSKGPIGALTSGAKNLVDNFSKYKQSRLDAIKKQQEAEQKRKQAELEKAKKKADALAKKDAEDAENEARKAKKRLERKLARAQEARDDRKRARDEREAERKRIQDEKDAEHRRKVNDGHILLSNFKFKYRQIILTFSAGSGKLQDLLAEGKIEPGALAKMVKYGKAIDTMFQKFPGTLVTSIRQKKFVQHAGMRKLLSKSEGSTKAEDGPYKLIHPLFTPRVGHSHLLVTKYQLIEFAENNLEHLSVGSDEIGNPNYGIGFSASSCIKHFDQILKATSVGTIDYIVVSWYYKTYNAITEYGKNMMGVDDPRLMGGRENDLDPVSSGDYVKEQDMAFPLRFFENFSDVFELIRMENLRLYTTIEELIRKNGSSVDVDQHASDSDIESEFTFDDALDGEPDFNKK